MRRLFLLILFVSAASIPVFGQAWSGLLAPSRAINWSNSGAGTIPPRTTICSTLGTPGQVSNYSQSVTASQIVSALQGCPSGDTVLLNPGTYTMTSTLFGGSVATPSNVTLRGSGPQQTILKWTSTSNNCNGIGAVAFCIYNGDAGSLNYSANVLTVSSGTSQGSTSLVLGGVPSGNLCGSTSSPVPCNGSIANLHNGSLLQLTALDESTDNGNYWACGTTGSNGSCSEQGVANAWKGRVTTQIVTVQSISGSTVTISPGIYAPDWASGRTVFASFSSTTPVNAFGLENLTVNTQSLGDIQAMVESMWATDSWIKNVSFVNSTTNNAAARKHAEISSSTHFTVRDSYAYGSSPTSEAYGIDFILGTSDSLAENNICQHLATCAILETGVGNVFGYNYAVDNFYIGNPPGSAPNWQQCDAFHHDGGDIYNLWEGHEGTCFAGDDIHGTADFLTAFRSYFSGRDLAHTCPPSNPSCGTTTKTLHTPTIEIDANNRYFNFVANVLGSSYDTDYQHQGASGSPSSCPSYNWTVIYMLNFGDGGQIPFSPACWGSSFTIDNDSLVSSTLMRWGNWDSVNGAVRTMTTEDGSTAGTYPALASPSTSWSSYCSFYLSTGCTAPLWWNFPDGTTTPFPAVGPDVTGGNISGTGGHAWLNPAANNYLNVLHGATDGSSGVLPFDGSVYYTLTPPTCADPQQIDPWDSGTYPYSDLPFTIGFSESTTGCSMFYNETTDGTLPASATCSSTPYPSGNFTLTTNGTFRFSVIACGGTSYTPSGVVGGQWIVNPPIVTSGGSFLSSGQSITPGTTIQ